MRSLNKTKLALALALLAGTAGTSAWGAGFFTNGVPSAGGSQYPSTVPLTGAETLGADTNLPAGLNPASEAISVNQLSAFGSAQSSSNLLIGGDASTNAFQRATSGASVTTTVTYGGPDRWAYWSGTSTALTLSKDTTTSDVPVGYSAAFKLARTASQTGVVQSCMAQEIESSYAIQLAGQTVELDFNAYTGANFSAANAQINAYIVSGTGTDDGMQKLAYGLNAGGGGSSGWTGQANATVGLISLGAVSTAGRYVAVANIPATATEVGVVLCFTPVGTAGTNDYVAFSGIQLRKNNALSALASSTVGYSAAAVQASGFERRAPALELELQQRYYYQLTENATISAVAACKAVSVTVANCFVQFPTTMRTGPTMTYANGFATETTTAGGTLGACTTLATSTGVTSTASSPVGVLVSCTATTVPAAGSAAILYSNGGTGTIKASAEF